MHTSSPSRSLEVTAQRPRAPSVQQQHGCTRWWVHPGDDSALEREITLYAHLIDTILADAYPILCDSGYLPLSTNAGVSGFLGALCDGTVLAHLAHALHPDAIDLTLFAASDVVMSPASRTVSAHRHKFAMQSQVTVLLAKLASPPFRIPLASSLTASDVTEGKAACLLGLAWSLLRIHILTPLNWDVHSELIYLARGNVSIPELVSMPRDRLLMQWVNYHLDRAGSMRRIKNFGPDLSDGVVLAIVSSQIAGDRCNPELLARVVDLPLKDQCSKLDRAEMLLENFELIGVSLPLDADDLASGRQRVAFVLVATLFAMYPGLPRLPAEEEMGQIQSQVDFLTAELSDCRITCDDLRNRIDIEKEEVRDQTLQAEFEVRKAWLAKEFQLYNRIEDLELMLKKQEAMHQSELRSLRENFFGYHRMAMDRLGRYHHWLSSYNDHRQEVLTDAQIYTIGAFNNEGKRVTFQIPAPGIKTKCVFSLDGQYVGSAKRPPTPAVDASTSSSNMASSSTPTTVANSGAMSISSRDDCTATASIYRINRHHSCPPDVIMDVQPVSEAVKSLRSSVVEPVGSYRRRSLVDEKIVALMGDMTSVGDQLHHLIRRLIEENIEQMQQIQLLAAKVDEMSWLNQTMGDKIRTFSEAMIEEKRNSNRTSRRFR